MRGVDAALHAAGCCRGGAAAHRKVDDDEQINWASLFKVTARGGGGAFEQRETKGQRGAALGGWTALFSRHCCRC